MSEYKFQDIENKWQKYWSENDTFNSDEGDQNKPKYYVLDMFPYPSGAGLHVGHPLGYIATDIVSRFKRINGFNVLHPMGFDSFGLPAEQYAIKTGQHPAKTTAANILRFKEQLGILGFSFDWKRELRTSDPEYYKWTQWIFIKLFESFYDQEQQKARPISELEIPAGLSVAEKEKFLDNHRLAYQDEIVVNWCPALGTVLANEEVINGRSERGNHPVERKPMRQWVLRITEYSDRLLDDLNEVEWPESIKLSQKNWIGRSHGAEIDFVEKSTGEKIRVFTTRPDTIFGATYMVLAPEHELVKKITTESQSSQVLNYVEQASQKSDLERSDLDKSKTGVFTGSYAINPANGNEIPIWISDYVLVSYGTGAIMAVPGGDQRDFDFARKFDLDIVEVVSPSGEVSPNLEEAYSGQGKMINSGEYNGLTSEECAKRIIADLESKGAGNASINYKLRDWIFNRQRYWGEPIPIIKLADGTKKTIPESELPLLLPEVESYTGTEDGESPLAKETDWVNIEFEGKPATRETNTMPQWAGSCWYYMRFTDPGNPDLFADRDKTDYWLPVDLYIGGAEHAVLHLLYARFWHKVLYDLGYVSTKEPFKKLINQGMIQGRSNLIYRIKGENRYISHGLKEDFSTDKLHVDVNIVNNDILDIEAFRNERPENKDAEFVLENGKYVCGFEIEKMSKSLLNVVSPDDVVENYGADTFRMYEMFLGPIEQAKPWNTHGIDGVHKFLKKFWNLFFDDDGQFKVSEDEPNADELKIVHKTIKKVREDISRYSFNTSVSAFMICVNELQNLKGKSTQRRKVLEPLVIALSPFAPHMTEELWSLLGHNQSISFETYPEVVDDYIQEANHEYPISVNGKMRTKISFSVEASNQEIEDAVLANEVVLKWTEGKTPKKVIVVPKRIVNIVV